jgi:hypothetical protein
MSVRLRFLRRLLLATGLAAGTVLFVFAIGKLGREASANRRLPALDGLAKPLGRLYSPSSPFNQRIPANAAAAPDSGLLVSGLADAARKDGLLVAVARWTVPVYVAGARTPRYRVALTASWAPAHALRGVPIPRTAQPDPAADGHLAVLDRAKGCEYDFWKARRQGRGWSAAWGNSVRTNGRGVFPHGLSARGSGFALLAGLIWPDELARGRIDHALVFSYPYTSAAGFVSPATESDGTSTRPDAIPEGARLQLDPSLDLDSLMLPPYERTIARALQRYGMYLADTGSNVGLYAVSPQSYPRNPYSGIFPGGSYVYLRGIPVDRFRVLERGPTTPKGPLALAPSGCGSFR